MNTFGSKPSSRTPMKMPENRNSDELETLCDKTTTVGQLEQCSSGPMTSNDHKDVPGPLAENKGRSDLGEKNSII